MEYFVSYYDYYQPEAYVASTDTYIEKDAQINETIEKLRHSATASLLERRDVIIIASVSCIYGLGSPEFYKNEVLNLRPGQEVERDDVLRKLIEIQYERNDVDFKRGTFRVRGDCVEVMPASSSECGIRIEFFGDEVDRIAEFDYLTGKIIGERSHVAIYPNTHYVTDPEYLDTAIANIEQELEERLAEFKAEGKLLEAQRLEQRTRYDLEMLREVGYCSGVENYARPLSGRAPGSTPDTLLDFFPPDLSPSSTKATWRCHRSAVCSPATARARKISLNMVFVCRRRWTTVRSILRNLRRRCTRRSMCQQRQAIMSSSTASRLWSRSSAQRGFWIRPSRSIRSPGRSTISSIACVGALCATSVCS